jgi:hypothetical protein
MPNIPDAELLNSDVERREKLFPRHRCSCLLTLDLALDHLGPSRRLFGDFTGLKLRGPHQNPSHGVQIRAQCPDLREGFLDQTPLRRIVIDEQCVPGKKIHLAQDRLDVFCFRIPVYFYGGKRRQGQSIVD